MATATAFSTLAVPLAEDTMEMSSPASRNLEDDIDIDFDDYQGLNQLTDDEHMLEDTTRPATATDEMMDDDLQPAAEVPQVAEEVMQDDVPTIEADVVVQDDEELIDYGEDDIQEGDMTEVPNFDEPQSEAVTAAPVDVDEVIEMPAEEPLAEPAAPALGGESSEVLQVTKGDAKSESTVAAGRHAEDQLLESSVAAEQAEIHDQSYEEHHVGLEEHAAQPAISIDTALEAEADGPATPTDTGLHPVTLRFGDLQVPLFKSRRQLDGLVKDDNLVNLSLADLISACRLQLVSKREQVISDSQELVLSFDDLGLVIGEDAREASAHSLNDLLEVYLQLHRNDGVEEIAPLQLDLSPRLRFSYALTTFKQAAQTGQGMSAFSLLHGESGEDESRNHAENAAEYHDYLEGEFAESVDDQDYDENTYNEHEGDYTDMGPENGHQNHAEKHPDPDQDQEQTYGYQEYAEGEEYDQNFGETTDDPDPLTGEPADQPHEDDAEDPNFIETAPGESQPETTAAEFQLKDHNTPKASSVTLHDNTTSEEQTATGQLDDTTLNTEYDDATHTQAHGDQHDTNGEDFLEGKVNNPEGYQQYYDDGQDHEGHEEPQFADNSFAQLEDGDDQTGEQPDDVYAGFDFDEPAGHDVEGHSEHADFIAGLEEATDEPHDEEEFDDTVIISRPEENAEDEQHDLEQPNDTFDDINFDEDDAADGEQLFDPKDQAAESMPIKATSNGSPLGKRSFDDFDEPEDELVEMPKIKKVRSR